MKTTTIPLKYIEKAFLIRKVEEAILNLYSQGKLNGTVHTCVGQEFTGVCISEFLTPDDFVVSNHRGHGHYIARTNDVKGMLAEVMGKQIGAAGGIGGSQHLCNVNYISNGIQGGMTPIASGIALGYKLKETKNIAVAYIGDGTLGEGILYETLNLSSLWNCPVLYVLEHNCYAQSTSFKQNFAGNIAERIKGFDVKYFYADTWDIDNLLSVSEEAINYVRNESKPAFIEISTYRLNSHSKGDDNRDDKEIAEFKQKDYLNQFASQYVDEYKSISEKIDKKIKDSLEEIEKSNDLLEYPNEVFIKEIKTPVVEILKEEKKRINDLIYEALKEELSSNSLSTIIGEDIEYCNSFNPKAYGGAFKVTKDLNFLFKERVRNTPISEAAIVGFSTGLAISGYRAIVEIMFGDFTTLTLDQLFQHACKFKRMFNNQVNVPLVVRTPMGGKRGYGPTHSQSIEKFFLGIPDLNVIVLNHRINPQVIYKNIFTKIKDPVLVIENKVLYTRVLNEHLLDGFSITHTLEDFPTIIISPINKIPDITIFCYGGILEDVEKAATKAFDEMEILCEIISPSSICPINIYPLVESVKLTKKILIVEEGCNFASLSSEMISALCEKGLVFEKVRRLSNNNIIPCSYKAEINLIPNVESIYKNITEIYYE